MLLFFGEGQTDLRPLFNLELEREQRLPFNNMHLKSLYDIIRPDFRKLRKIRVNRHSAEYVRAVTQQSGAAVTGLHIYGSYFFTH